MNLLLLELVAVTLFVVAFLLEEAAVWFTRNAVATLREDPDDEHATAVARNSREARILSQFFLGAGAATGGLALGASGIPGAPAIALLVGVGAAALGAALFAPHGRGPLTLIGRALFRPLHGVGVLFRELVLAVRRVRGLRSPHGPGDRALELDRELRWLTGETGEDEAEKVLATLHEFGEALAEDVLVPREETVGLPAEATVADAIAVVAREGFSRYPVYQESLDNVVGILHVFDLLDAEPETPVRTLARPPLLTSGTKNAGRLLRDLQVSYNQIAVVVDEFGGTAGVVTVEDLLEELVGEIRDETDEEEALVRALEPGVYWVDAGIGIDDLNETLHLDLEEGEYDTLAGFVLDRLERIPRAGETLRADGALLEVAVAEPHRIHAFRLTLLRSPAGEAR